MTGLAARLASALADRYAIDREIGRGGMAVVYLARGARDGRRIALKVLTPDLAQALGPDRFLREIDIASKLSHPRIVPLLESGTADGLLFYAMPFVEGESLRQRLDREKQLPVDDAIDIARQVAAALAYAHGQGIVHRDIKPENILLSGGEALVADFGIARAVSVAGGDRLTVTGIAVGTPVYMSPEQASGAPDVDVRSDLYSLAAVLYEMLAGEPPFTGRTAQAITARKLSHPVPDVTLLRAAVPVAVANAVRRALAPVPADRYATAGQFSEALRGVREGPRSQPSQGVPVRGRRWERVSWLAAGAIATVLILLGTRWWGAPEPAQSGTMVRTMLALPPGVEVTRGPGHETSSLALSPDGRTLVIAGTDADGQRLYARPLDRLEAAPLAGTEGGSGPFFSPDGDWIGFFANGRLRRVPAVGGTAVEIAAVAGFLRGASWTPDDRVVFGAGVDAPLYVVGVDGGEVQPLTRLEGDETGHGHPELLPDGRTLLFEADGWIHALDLATGRRASLAQGGSPRFADGHVILGRGQALLIAPFSPARLDLSQPLVPLVERVEGGATTGPLHFAVSRDGTLAYLPAAMAHDLVVTGPDGVERLIADESLTYENPQFSPDGRLIAVAARRGVGERSDIWVHDVGTGAASRLTFDGGRAPVWTPDGRAVTFSRPGGARGIYTQAADGHGDAEQVRALDNFHWLVGWTPDGRTLAFGQMEDADAGPTTSSIMAVADGEARRVVGPGRVWGGRLSPDGRWLAYYTQDAGAFQVFVTPFPGGRARWVISDEGGRDPSWGPDGTEIYYRSGERLIAARIDTAAGVRVLGRRLVLEPFSPPLYDDYDVHPDGRTLALVRPRGGITGREVALVLGWPAGLGRTNDD